MKYEKEHLRYKNTIIQLYKKDFNILSKSGKYMWWNHQIIIMLKQIIGKGVLQETHYSSIVHSTFCNRPTQLFRQALDECYGPKVHLFSNLLPVLEPTEL